MSRSRAQLDLESTDPRSTRVSVGNGGGGCGSGGREPLLADAEGARRVGQEAAVLEIGEEACEDGGRDRGEKGLGSERAIVGFVL